MSSFLHGYASLSALRPMGLRAGGDLAATQVWCQYIDTS
ncbi:hypothetical protein MMSP_3572 [Mycobacterium sp. 012931]|nr:hypothetical protein MMSP_3572 [Mycobacterium sp. 012931]